MEEQQPAQTESVFDRRNLKEIYEEIRQVYLGDSRAWAIGYSGGKDSTCALQLIWAALAEMPRDKLLKPVYVISSDTLVETPVIVDYIDTTLKRINKAAGEQGLPFKAEKVKPILEETFWVNLLGRGYPAPSKTFRWCTERMKIRPADRFIMDKVSKHGEVVVVLGVRKAESTTRAQVMSLYKIRGSLLSRHSRFPSAYVYTPVEDFSVDDVWSYLLQSPSPWGSNNRDLVALYRSASAGECPLVVDETTPSCGNSRFGCWVCTVVQKDRAMESLIDSGEEWMQPLLEFRDLLASTQVPETKHVFREYKRRDGQVWFKSDGSGISRGPYKLEFCAKLLGRLLQAQEQVRKGSKDSEMTLIYPEELHEIRRIWRLERGDWQDLVPRVYKETTGRELVWVEDDGPVFDHRDAEMISALSAKHGVLAHLVIRLIDIERQSQGMARRASIFQQLDRVLGEEWRPEAEVLGLRPERESAEVASNESDAA